MIDAFGDEYSIIIVTDHGGHDRSHGVTLDADMIIPFFFYGSEFAEGKEVEGLSFLGAKDHNDNRRNHTYG